MRIKIYVTKQLENRYIEHWKTLLFNDNKSGGNKLRTYRKLRTQFHLENYLCADINKKSISTFVKIRISNSKHAFSKATQTKLCCSCVEVIAIKIMRSSSRADIFFFMKDQI